MNDNIKIGADINAGDGGYSEGTQEKYDKFVKGRNQSLGKMRILELAEQAEQHANEQNDKHGTRFKSEYDRKFAELIVKEMLQTCEDHPSWSGRMIGEQIKQHFGVEE